ncbi:MAG: CotH kinase family protein, partial [Terriglobus sp.]
GYLVEIDEHQDDTFTFISPTGLPMGSDDPDPPNAQQQPYLVGAVAAAETALYSSDFTNTTTGWPAYFDQDSAVKWYLAEEIMNNQDGDFYSSDYFYKKRGDQHLFMGPLWDFDISSGNVNYSNSLDPSVMWIRNTASWYEQLFQDPVFNTATASQYTASRAQIADIMNFIDTQAASLQNAADNNYHRWRTLNLGVWPNSQVPGSFNGEVAFLKSWLSAHLTAMDAIYLQNDSKSKRAKTASSSNVTTSH